MKQVESNSKHVFNLDERILVYEEVVVNAIELLNKDYGIKIKRTGSNITRIKRNKDGELARVYTDKTEFRVGDVVTSINHYQAILILNAIGKVLGKDYMIPDSQQQELALSNGIIERETLDGDVLWTWRSDIAAYDPEYSGIKELLKGTGIEVNEYPVLIRNPGVEADKSALDGFRYTITEKTIIIPNATFLSPMRKLSADEHVALIQAGGKSSYSGYFNNDDPGLLEIGFPYKVSEGRRTKNSRKLYSGNAVWGLCAVLQDGSLTVNVCEKPSYSHYLGGVRALENLQPRKEKLGALVSAGHKVIALNPTNAFKHIA